jgi:2-keto-4-pentenoate hydratase/2-oxohepta-3-ene-1,7-dioic acid hydratase in catechol pathway
VLPIERPQKIICVGLNYRDHAEESGTSPPERPIEIVAFASEAITLEPGDLIATGTPAGVGFARTPPVWLRPGTRSPSRSTGSERSRTRW